MAKSENIYTGNGSTTTYSFTFPYLKSTDVKVTKNDALLALGSGSTQYTQATTSITLGTAPASGDKIRIYRDTDTDGLTATFYPGSAIRSADLNDNFTQNLYCTQEVVERYVDKDGLGTMTGNLKLGEDVDIVFEGSSDDAFETTLTVANTTGSDKTITLPNETGTVVTTVSPNVIDSHHYVDGSIDLEHMSANSVDSDQYVDGSIDGVHIANDQIDSQHYAAGSIDLEHMAANSVDSDQYVDGSIDLVHMSANSVDSDQYVDGSIDLVHMSANSVDSDQYVDGSIDTAHYADQSVTKAKFNDALIVTASEQASATADDNTFFTTSASDARYFKQDTGGTGETYDSSATWSGNDTHIATTKAIDNRVVDLIDEVGGFIAIASEAVLPSDHPEKENVTADDRVGTILSRVALTATYTPSGGTCTIPASTLTNHSVNATITDCGSQVLTSGFGLLIETTAQNDSEYAAGPQYKFHRLVPKAAQVDTVATKISEVETVADDITNVNTVAGSITNVNTVAGSVDNVNLTGGSIANVNTVGTNIATVNHYANEYQYAGSANSPTTDPTTRRTGGSLAEGDVWFDTTANLLKVYNGSAWETAVASPNALILKSTVDQKGDLLTASAADTVIRTPVGTNHKMLKADSTANGGVSWDLIDSENIENGAIDLAHMSANSVDSEQYVEGSIELVHLANDCID